MARFFFFFVVVFLVCVTSCYSVKVVDVDTICKNATNPSFCSNLLHSNPSGSGDLVNLAQYTISVLHSNVTNIIDEIDKLIKQNAGNFAAEIHYQTCAGRFERETGALGGVVTAEDCLNKGDYSLARYQMSYVEAQMFVCLQGGAPGDPPFDDPSLLPKHVGVAKQITEIVASILSYLIKP